MEAFGRAGNGKSTGSHDALSNHDDCANFENTFLEWKRNRPPANLPATVQDEVLAVNPKEGNQSIETAPPSTPNMRKRKFPAAAGTVNENEAIVGHTSKRSANRQYQQCIKCTEVFYKKSELQDHQRDDHGMQPGWKCKYCPQNFDHLSPLNKHFKDAHKIGYLYQCQKCTEDILGRLVYDDHLEKQHDTINGWECVHCFSVSERLTGLLTHVRMRHDDVKYKYIKSSETFSDNLEFARHSQSHDISTWKCTHCSEASASQAQHEEHMSVAPQKPKYQCEGCVEGFSEEGEFCKYQEDQHEVEAPWRCQHCSDAESASGLLKLLVSP